MKLFTLVIMMLSLTACGQLISNAKKEFAEDLSATMLEYDDPITVSQAVPAYLLLVSSMIRGDENNIGLLISGSRLYGSYASVFAEDDEQKRSLAAKSFDYASRAVCLQKPVTCDARSKPYTEFEHMLKQLDKTDAPALFAYGSAWAGLVQVNSADWNAIADLPRVKASIQRVLELDETIDNGDAHLYMGVMQSFLPPAMGGKPDVARRHFERALEISNRSNLFAMVLYAEKYARLMFDRDLHDGLLNEVLNASPDKSQMLINTIAKSRAMQLLESANDYF